MLIEILLERRKKELFSFFAIDEKKFRFQRILYAAILLLIATIMLDIIDKSSFFIGYILAIIIGYKFPYFKILARRKEIDQNIAILFPEFVLTFLALLPTTKNIYYCLTLCKPYVRQPLLIGFEELLEKLQDNKTDIRTAYLDFANFVGTSEAIVIMDMIYQFGEFGINDKTLRELEEYATDLQQNSVNELIDKKVNSMETIGILPLIASILFSFGFIIIVFMHYLNIFNQIL